MLKGVKTPGTKSQRKKVTNTTDNETQTLNTKELPQKDKRNKNNGQSQCTEPSLAGY